MLEEHQELIEQVQVDLQRGLKRPGMGRHGLTPPQVLRSLVLMRVKNWQYRELRECIADGYTLRCFTHFYAQPVPEHHAFNRAFNRLTPAVLQFINELVVQAAVELGLEDGKQLRVDTTVVQTDIRHPTDSALLWDSVRVITRLVQRLGEIIPTASRHSTSAHAPPKRRHQQIQRMTSSQRQTRLTGKYRELIVITEEVVQSARAVLEKTKDARLRGVLDSQEFAHYCQLGERVLDQTRRRVLQGEQVPNSEIDGATNQTTTIPAGLDLQQIAVNTASNTAYVTGAWYHQPARIFIIDGATLATNTISVADPNDPSDGLQGPIAVNSTTNKIYVTHVTGQVSVIDDGKAWYVSRYDTCGVVTECISPKSACEECARLGL